jgi:hypothetical protein
VLIIVYYYLRDVNIKKVFDLCSKNKKALYCKNETWTSTQKEAEDNTHKIELFRITSFWRLISVITTSPTTARPFDKAPKSMSFEEWLL